MAKQKHLDILNQGVERWNEWREVSEVVPDLGGAALGGYYLAGVNFDGAILNGAFLNSTNLSQSRLRNAQLVNAILHYTDLSDADLSGSFLMGTDLRWANLKKTNLFEAHMGDTIIGGVILSEANNLDSVKHLGPSCIDVTTIAMSNRNIPEKFQRGCGVPEEFITYMSSLMVKPIEFYSCFISYSSKDEEFAKRLYNDLQSEGVRCWFAPEDLKIGDRFRVRIDESIRLYDKLVLVLSENSVASEWVGDEVEAALEKEQAQGGRVVLFPLRLDDAVTEIKEGWPAKVRRTRHIGDFSDWKSHDSYKKAFERLMRDLRAGG